MGIEGGEGGNKRMTWGNRRENRKWKWMGIDVEEEEEEEDGGIEEGIVDGRGSGIEGEEGGERRRRRGNIRGCRG